MLRQVIKITAGLFIDLIIILCLAKSILIFININLAICFLILCVLYTLFAYFNCWITPGRKLVMALRKKKEPLTKISAKKLFSASFFDWFLIFSFTLLFNILIRQFVFVDTIVLFTIVAPFYYIFSFLFFKQTLGYYLCGIELISKPTNKQWHIPVLKRELFKFGLSAWLPLELLRLFHVEISYNNALLLLMLNSVVLLFYYTARGEAWWNTIAKTQAQKSTVVPKFRKLILAGLMGFIGITFPSVYNSKISRTFAPFIKLIPFSDKIKKK